MTVREGLIAAACLYMEETEFGGSDIDTAVKELYDRHSSTQ